MSIFQHFGHTQEFKVYEIEDNKIKNSEVIGNGGAGHEANCNHHGEGHTCSH